MGYDPIFSCIITISVLIILYFPNGFSILFSPVIVLTVSLLLCLLRLGVIQRIETEDKEKGRAARLRGAELEEEEKETESAPVELKSATCKNEPDLIIRSLEERFVEWDVRAPLEVIYEDFEGEEGKDPDQSQTRAIERYSSLSLYYPESDSDSSSSEEEKMDFPSIGKWVTWEEEDKEGLIEIALYKREIDFHGEDDSFIEINIS